MHNRRSRLASSLRLAGPALIGTVPLAGFAFHFDERRTVYRNAYSGTDNPLDAIRYSYRSIDTFLEVGNFRPVGRFFQSLVNGFAFEAAEATGLPPHAVHGALRLVAVLILAVLAVRVVTSLMIAAGCRPHPVVLLYPLALGATLVANGRSGPLVYFSVVFVGAAALSLAVCLAVTRDDDMRSRRMRARDVLPLALLGAVAAMYHDLVYVAPPLAAAFMVARATAAGLPLRRIVHTAAFGRWLSLSVGFLAIFVPARLEIAGRCARNPCYPPSEISVSGDIPEILATRVLSGAPPSGWILLADMVEQYGPAFGMANLVANSLLFLLLAGVAAVTIVAAVRIASYSADRHATSGERATSGDRHGERSPGDGWLRLCASLLLLGATTVLLPSLLVSLSSWVQRSRIDYGWRDTVLVQVGWSFIILSTFVAVLGLVATFARSKRPNQVAAAAAATVLGTALSLTLLANARLAQIDRHEPGSAITNQLATAAISFDPTGTGNAYRCALIDSYSQLRPENSWVAGPGVREDLDRLTLDRHGLLFCDPDQITGDAG